MKSILQETDHPGTEPDDAVWRPSIRLYLILMNVILLFLLFPTVSFLFLNEVARFRDVQLERTITQMRRSLESRGGSLARSMALSAGQAIAGYDFTFLNILADQVVANDPEILYCIIMDVDGKVIAHNDPKKIGVVLAGQIDNQVKTLLKQGFPSVIAMGKHSESIRFINVDFPDESDSGSEPVMEAVVPVYSGARLWGGLRCGYSLKHLHEKIQTAKNDWAAKMEQFKIYFLSMTAVFFSIGVVVAALFTRSLLRSMSMLNAGVNRVSEGDLEYQLPRQGMVCSEFINLSGAFNSMTNELRDSYRQLGEYSRSLEQKVEERTKDLREAQANLMKQAHEAGMAEMAVGVLHNIGNAITPAKVGATLLLRKLDKSPIRRHLHVIMAQIREVLEKPAKCSEEERQRMFSIIELLPESIKEEYEAATNELRKIQEKHDHIEGIIRLQMRYARLYGHSEEVDVNRVAEDALHILEESINKRSVTVHKDFPKVPCVRFEQAKLIQIFVNLIKNGFEAMDKCSPEERLLEISTRLEEGSPDYVVLSIKDHGIGFSPGEKEKLFTFGYTTKSKGSGFGLHSCANYLIANKGSIDAKSEGQGKGSEFIVRLPVHHNEAGDNVHA
jgi:signal transduction histidine kinase